MKKIYILAALGLGIVSCKPKIEPAAPERGDADFSVYMAVGSSFTAGVTDGSYYLTGQKNSYPQMLSEQFATVGGGEFKQPMVAGDHGWPLPKWVLDYYQGPCDSLPYITPVRFKGALDTTGTYMNIFGSKGPFNNMAIVGTKSTDYLVAGLANSNKYAARMFKKPATATGLQELLVPGHTFFTAWVGMDDVLDYLMAGGETGAAPGSRSLLTTTADFQAAYDSIISTLTRNGAKGVVMTLPQVLDMPYFNVIPAKGMYVSAKDANMLNIQYNSTQVHFDPGMNHFVIQDDKAPNGFREIKDGEYVRMSLPLDSVKCAGWGWKKPIPSTYVITADEVQNTRNAIQAYNGIIERIADKYELPVADIHYFMSGVAKDGAQYNAANYNFEFVKGGIFSLDGMHLTGRGNALLANTILNTINAHYKSSIPPVDVNQYTGVKIP